jgi:hypothetical protein
MDDIIRMAREAWGLEFIPDYAVPKLERFYALACADEREACAKVCDEYDNGRHANAADLCAAAIRARGDK